MFEWTVLDPQGRSELQTVLNNLEKQGYTIYNILANRTFYTVVAYKEKR